MKRTPPVKTLFVDFGGILLNNGWDHIAPRKVAKHFKLDGPKFKLDGFVDFFVSSCFVHIRKPDADIFRLALNTSQTPVQQVVYIENTPMFVQIAEGLRICSILHTDYKSTYAQLASFGLSNEGAFSATS